MKTLWITERFPPDRGGVASSAQRQVEGLAPHLERVDVITLSGGGEPGRVILTEGDGYRLYRVGGPSRQDESLQTLWHTASHLDDEHGYDVIQGFFAVHAGYVAAHLARTKGISSVVALRGNDVDRAMFHGPRLPFLRWALEHATVLTSVSEELALKARALSGRDDPIPVVPNGVDSEIYCPGATDHELAQELEGCDRPWVGFSGELRFKKGLPVLQEIAEEFARQQKGTLVCLGGVRRDERDGFESWKRERPLAAARWRDVAYRNDKASLAAAYRSLDMFVFPSFWDGLPNAVLEAMACAKPVFGARAGGIPEVLKNEETGVLVEPKELSSLGERLLREWETGRDRLCSLGRAAREFVSNIHSLEAERRALLGVYERLASNK